MMILDICIFVGLLAGAGFVAGLLQHGTAYSSLRRNRGRLPEDRDD